MDPQELQRRAETARRLKAARWIAGTLTRKGKSYEIKELTQPQLAARPDCAENGITASKIGKIERLERPTPPMERAAIARALGQPEEFFEIDEAELSPDFVQVIARQLLAEVDQAAIEARKRKRRAQGGTDLPGPSTGGDDA